MKNIETTRGQDLLGVAEDAWFVQLRKGEMRGDLLAVFSLRGRAEGDAGATGG